MKIAQNGLEIELKGNSRVWNLDIFINWLQKLHNMKSSRNKITNVRSSQSAPTTRK